MLGGKWCCRDEHIGVRSTSIKNVGYGVCAFPKLTVMKFTVASRMTIPGRTRRVDSTKVSLGRLCAKPPSPPFWLHRTRQSAACAQPHALIFRQSMDAHACPCFVCYSPLGMRAQVGSLGRKFILLAAKEVGKRQSGRGNAHSGSKDDRLRAPRVRARLPILPKDAQSAPCAHSSAAGAAGPPAMCLDRHL